MTAWWENWFLAVDTETTGLDTTTDRIVEIAAVLVHPDGHVIGEPWHRIIDAGVEVPAEAAAIHGITTERCQAEGVPPVLALAHLADLMNEYEIPVVMYNARFDLPLILAECARHGVELPHLPLVLDPFVVDKAVDRYRKGSRKLVDTAAHYGVHLDPDAAHGAVADATAAGRLMHRLLAAKPSLKDLTLTAMFARTMSHAETQRASFEDYMRRSKDPEFSEPQGWPIPAGSVA